MTCPRVKSREWRKSRSRGASAPCPTWKCSRHPHPLAAAQGPGSRISGFRNKRHPPIDTSHFSLLARPNTQIPPTPSSRLQAHPVDGTSLLNLAISSTATSRPSWIPLSAGQRRDRLQAWHGECGAGAASNAGDVGSR
jgi:hypothetical protein